LIGKRYSHKNSSYEWVSDAGHKEVKCKKEIVKMGKGKSPFILLILAVILAVYFTVKAAMKDNFWIDEILGDIFAKVPDSVNPFFVKITELGNGIGIGIVGLLTLIWLLLKKKDFVGAAVLALAVALGNEISSLLKNGIERPRPNLEHLVHVNSYSFPSGHAMVGIILYFFIAFFLIKEVKSKLGKVLIGLVIGLLLLLIGASRIILQVHYPSDVIGGYALGYVWLYVWIALYHFFTKRLKK
jgi:membrane-associated phospholipid phosphatase